MKKSNWLMLILFSLAAAAMRLAQLQTGFEENGLPVSGSPVRVALPAVLALAALWFVLSARKLPAQRDVTGDLAERFLFENMFCALCGVGGAFAVLASSAFSFYAALVVGDSKVSLLLAAFLFAAALCVLCTVFALYRGNAVQGVFLLVPVCALVLCLAFLYRADAADPVLAHIYVEILAAAALTLSSLERAAFAFRNGAPRAYLPVSAMAVILSVCAAAESESLPQPLFYLGFALIELAFLAAADFAE